MLSNSMILVVLLLINTLKATSRTLHANNTNKRGMQIYVGINGQLQSVDVYPETKVIDIINTFNLSPNSKILFQGTTLTNLDELLSDIGIASESVLYITVEIFEWDPTTILRDTFRLNNSVARFVPEFTQRPASLYIKNTVKVGEKKSVRFKILEHRHGPGPIYGRIYFVAERIGDGFTENYKYYCDQTKAVIMHNNIGIFDSTDGVEMFDEGDIITITIDLSATNTISFTRNGIYQPLGEIHKIERPGEFIISVMFLEIGSSFVQLLN